MICHLASLGYPITDATMATPIYNDNDACVKWCHDLTTKGNCHIKHCKNATPKWVENGSITVTHVSGKCNPSDLFTKEMHNGANFQRLCDSFMSRGSAFLKDIYHSLHPLSTPHHNHIAQTAHYVSPPRPGMLRVLLSHPLFRTSSAISCLSLTG
jgi:hypothetical protein